MPHESSWHPWKSMASNGPFLVGLRNASQQCSTPICTLNGHTFKTVKKNPQSTTGFPSFPKFLKKVMFLVVFWPLAIPTWLDVVTSRLVRAVTAAISAANTWVKRSGATRSFTTATWFAHIEVNMSISAKGSVFVGRWLSHEPPTLHNQLQRLQIKLRWYPWRRARDVGNKTHLVRSELLLEASIARNLPCNLLPVTFVGIFPEPDPKASPEPAAEPSQNPIQISARKSNQRHPPKPYID